MWNYCGFYFFPAEIVFAIISMIYILLVVFFFIPSRQLYVQNRWWVCGLRCDLGMMCGLRCVCCWQWRYHNNGSWSHSGVFVVGFEQVNGVNGLVMYLKIVVFIYVYLIKNIKIANEKKKKFRIETIQKI